jgi:glycosyltransferase involved in cell wall biosynthesis
MIIKNEGPLLPRLFESVKGFATEYCIVDTGSTDDTLDVLKAIDMPGTIFEEPFVNFCTTRNFLLDKCRETTKCDYLLLLDADMILCVSPEWDAAKFDKKSKIDVYSLIQISSLEYENVRLIRTDAVDVKVVGSTHEYYDVPSHYRTGSIPKHLLYIQDMGDGRCKEDKYERDERLLRRELEMDSENPRTVFYLANTLKDQAKYADAIPYYVKRTQMGGYFAEADLSFTSLVQCYLGLDNEKEAAKYAIIAAFQRTVFRAEGLYYMAFYLHSKQKYDLAWYYANMASKITKPSVSQALFIHNDIYNYWIDYEKAMLPQYVFAERMIGIHHALKFLNNAFAPEYLRRMFVESTLAKYAPTLSAIPTTAGVTSRSVDGSGIVKSWHPLVVRHDGKEVNVANVPRIFNLFSRHESRLVEYNGSSYALAALEGQDLYFLVVFGSNFEVRTYTCPFRIDVVDKVDTLSINIVESEECVHMLRVAGNDIPLSKVLALVSSCHNFRRSPIKIRVG